MQETEQWYMVSGVAVQRRAVRKVLQFATSPEDAQQKALAAVGGDEWEASPHVSAPVVAPCETKTEAAQ